jgi:guanine nucleotide-binding protein subunit alpha
MGSCMSTPSEEPKRTPETTKQQPISTNTTPAGADTTNSNGIPLQSTSGNTPQSQQVNGNGNGLANERTSLVTAVGQNQDRGSDAQAISAALASTEGSIEKRGSKDRSNAIDKQLEDDQRKFKKECKILLLGKCYLGPVMPRSVLGVLSRGHF